MIDNNNNALNIVRLNEISDDTKLVRFVEENVLYLSVGSMQLGKWCYSFPLQLLSYFKKCEGISGDPNEGSTIINFGEKGSGNVTTCNEALISCWSVCNNANDPWQSLAESSYAKNKKKYPYVIMTTVGKVKDQIRRILEQINKIHRDEYGALIMNVIYGLVTYYPQSGMLLAEWNKMNDISRGIDITTILNIFHKPTHNKHGQRHDAEIECRFALIMNIRDFKGENGDIISIDEISKQLCYYVLSADDNLHYIEKIFSCKNENDKYHEVALVDFLKEMETVE
jgi:hypothetical protein